MFKLVHAKQQLAALTERVAKLETEYGKIMSALTDLEAVVTKLQTDIPAAVTAMNTAAGILQSVAAGTLNPDDPSVEAAATALSGLASSLETATSGLSTAEAAVTPSGGSTPTS